MRSLRSKRGIFSILAIALLCALASALLPNNAYQRYSQFKGTIYANLGWIYERMAFDQTPIDIAIFGSSRTLLAISAPQLQNDLAARGIKANAVNFSVIGSGRNVSSVIVDDLLTVKKPKLLIVEINETPYRYGHPAFQYLAPARDILAQPVGLHDQPYHLLYLPFRSLRLFAASWFPETFGLPSGFDHSAYRGAAPETTKSFRLPTGRWIEMDKQIAIPTLLAGARASEKARGPSRLPKAIADRWFGDDRIYIQKIADAAKAHKVAVVFVYLPYYSGPKTIAARQFYAANGMIADASSFSDKDRLYQGWAHLNHRGAGVFTAWLAGQIAPMLGTTPPPAGALPEQSGDTGSVASDHQALTLFPSK